MKTRWKSTVGNKPSASIAGTFRSTLTGVTKETWLRVRVPIRISCGGRMAKARCALLTLSPCRVACFITAGVEDRAVAAGVELQQDLPGSGTGEMNRNNQAFHEWHFTFGILWRHERDLFAAHTFSHRACLVETKQFVRVVDQQVEVGEEVFPEDSTNARIGCLNLSEVLDDDEGLFDHLGGGFERVQNGQRCLRIAGNGNETDLALRL